MYDTENLILNLVSAVTDIIIAVLAFITLPKISRNFSLGERIRKLTTRINRNPNNAILYVERGDLFFDQRDYAKASEDYNKAFEIDPKNKEAAEKRMNGIEKWLKEP
ncbi:MAG: tetratricopeptide repeat protein [Treponema sp.]|jgi:tetratricopeptide (TPR) repeat protein|nr:tetratricopeptide repeat protein [Treponema sp.]